MDRLQQLIEEGVIEEVYNQLKTGKEAEVWLVSHRGEPVAAKIYKEREFRSFKNDAGYKEGRVVRNTRTQRAMDKGTKFGRASAEEAWKNAEADAMFTLHAAGVRVPKPVMFYDGVLLMEVIGDAEGRVAPRLVEAAIAKEQAEALYVQLRGEIIKILSADLIHGDLSEFNILLGASGPVIIDFPQVVTAAKNSQSEKYFRRDLGNILRFFSSIDPSLNAKHAGDADEIWRAYVRRYLSVNFVPGGRSQQPQQHQQRPQHQQHRGGPPRQGQGPGQQRGPGQQGPAQQQRGQGFQRGPGQQQQQGGRPQGQPNQQRPQGQQQGGRPQQQGGRPQGQQQNQQRKGPEVSFRGAPPPPRNEASPAAHASRAGHGGGDLNDARRSNGPRRRPPRRF